ncbi:MAG: bifunctional diaminohydroxyphosphoribosylaminopyrimidine deaminase/5-amino-6-(5-phosphoribosylamino)uracil reductase RibD [Dehalococcoidia bacterium]|nr:MAG: bifunctional diaminohydroxyphosphoribosylaminopyrimidine deaminase/5-amino-6-(5-phosphoribosylamino)uracil reductase RibD [Dehalococcoidia bacterium]
MRLALDEAWGALGTTSPNPSVGAVIVRDGSVVGRGRTQPPGSAHAEVMALREAGKAARGATLYCTLEPCVHTGRTGPCTEAIIEAGVAAVRYSIVDLDAQVAGAGDARLRAAGLDVEAGDGAAESARVLEGYLKHRRTGLPAVIVKVAMSLDGRIAAASGDARWISGPEARDWVHRLRTQVDAVVVGSGTLVADDPVLTARPGGTVEGAHQPARVIVDSRAHTQPSARLFSESGGPVIVATIEGAPAAWRSAIESRGGEVLELPGETAPDGVVHVDLEALFRAFGQRGMLNVMVEGGGVLLGALFDRRLVDRLYAVIAPVIVGAAAAPSAVSGRGAQVMRDAPRLRDLAVTRLGEDVLVEGVPVWPDATAGQRDGK